MGDEEGGSANQLEDLLFHFPLDAEVAGDVIEGDVEGFPFKVKRVGHFNEPVIEHVHHVGLDVLVLLQVVQVVGKGALILELLFHHLVVAFWLLLFLDRAIDASLEGK